MAKGFFVTGTDTGVGKTIISAGLICFLNNLGYRTGAMKPVESGCRIQRFTGLKTTSADILIPNDGMFLKKIANMQESVDIITPIRFREPLAPFTASKIEGKPINIGKIKDAFSRLSKKYELLIVEGIGGLLVPIKKNYYVLDLAKDIGLPLIVVARPSLGTLNHTMLTVNYAIKEGLRVAGIIMNYNKPPENTIAEKTNSDILKKISPVPIIGIFPYLKNKENKAIEKTVLKILNADTIKYLL
ncbi:MAG: dethiobiotin synthase [Nitrospirae bacterium]|jgi:dethiobiotin synthetase|nr:dethiobiotin synthase [Nitrospirota bacterium]